MKRFLEKVVLYLQLLFYPDYWSFAWGKLFEKTMSVLGGISIFITIYLFFNPGIKISVDPLWLFILISTSVLFGIFLSLPPLSVSKTIFGKDISISVEVGNVFNQGGDVVVPTNSSFETKLDNGFTSLLSLQGQVYSKEYKDVDELNKDMDEQLSEIKPIGKNNDETRKEKIYNIGAIIKLNHSNKYNTYWVSLADINNHGKPDGKFENIQIGLSELWKYLELRGHMTKLVMPILGSGKTGTPESRYQILQEIIFSFVAYSSEMEKKITEDLVICVYPKDMIAGKIDMREVERFLDYQCRYRYRKPSKRAKSTSKGVEA